MTSGVPWQVEARATAREAARRSGVSIGEWIRWVINEPGSAPEARDRAEPGPASCRGSDADHREAEALAQVRGRLDAVGRRLDQLSRQNAGAAYPGSPTRASGDLADLIGLIDRRLDQLLARGGPDGAAAADPNAGRPAAAPARPLEQALLEIAEAQRALDSSGAASGSRSPPADALPRAPTAALAGLEQQLRQVTRQIENLRPCGIEKALDTLRDELAEIGLMLKEAMPRQAIERLQNEVRSLSARLEPAPLTQCTDAAIASVERGFAEIREALRALAPAENLAGIEKTVRDLSHRLDHIGPNLEHAGALQQLEVAILELRGLASQVASDRAHEVAALAAKVDQIATSGADLLSTLEHRIAAIADALDHRGEGTATLPRNLDAVVRGLAEKLDASSSRLDQIESIERGLCDLVASLERRQAEASRAAPASEVSWLRRDMQQARSPLAGVEEALGRPLERLPTTEADPRSTGPPAATMSTATAAAPRETGATPTGKSSLARDRPGRAGPGPAQFVTTAFAGAEPAAAPEWRPIDPSLPPDPPIKPGALRTHNREPPGGCIAAAEAALAAAKLPVIPGPDGRSNFIAAARRAAQAASSEAARSDKRTPAAATAPKSASAWSNRVRAPALVAVSVVIIVLGARNFAVGLFSGADGPDRTPPAETYAENPAAVAETPAGSDNNPAPSNPRRPPTELIPGAATEPNQGPITAAPAQDVTGSVGRPVAAASAGAASQRAPSTARLPATDKLPAAFSSTLRAAALRGNAGAEYEIAQRYADGRGVPQNFAAAAEWFARAAKQGLVLAQFRLGRFYEQGFGVKKDLEAARRLYAAAAEAGNAKAMHNLAVLYAEGMDGKPDYVTAAKWFRQAAGYGLADSQYNLGILYARGLGVETDLAKAYKWLALAARDGDKEAASKREDVGGRLDPRLLAAAKLELESWTTLDPPEAATQVFAPPGGWDPVIPAPPANP